MANYIATTEQFNATAAAIRAKTGDSAGLEWDASTGFADDIAAISTGTDTSDATAAASDIRSPKTGYVDGVKVTGTVPTKTSSDVTVSSNTVAIPAGIYDESVSKTVGTAKSAETYNTSTSDQTIASGKYLTGTQTIRAVTTSGIDAASIKDGVVVKVGDAGNAGRIKNITGTFTDASTVSQGQTAAGEGQILSGYSAWVDGEEVEGSIQPIQGDTYAPFQNYTFPAGKYIASDITVYGARMRGSADQIKYNAYVGMACDAAPDVTFYPIHGTFTGASTVSSGQTAASESQIISGYSAWVDGEEVKGNIPIKTSLDLQIGGDTVYVPVGYYSNGATGSVISGTAGTPTATKGTVSNNSISVTPSVMNLTGFIFGSTKTGTAVTVSASELVSGTKTITGSGETDVTNYKKASVAAGSATAPASISGSSATVTTGTNTLTLTKSVSVTPSVTAGYVSSGTAGNSSVSLTASVTTKAAATINTSTSDQTISSGQYLTGAQTIKAVTVSNLTAANIKSGVVVNVGDANSAGRIASVTGTYAPKLKITYGTTGSGDATPSNHRPLYPVLTIKRSNGTILMVAEGTLDMATGLVTATKLATRIDALSWTYQSQRERMWSTSLSSVIAVPSSNNITLTGLACSCYTTMQLNRTDATTSNPTINNIGVATSGGIGIRDTEYTTVADWLKDRGSDIIVYPLASSTTYQLTSTEISALIG